MDDYLHELFAPPINLKAAYKLDGLTFYSSVALKQKFILAFEKSSKGKGVAQEVRNLVEDGIVVPSYKSKNLLSFMRHKLSRNSDKYIMAFYVVDDKKVVVIIDNESTVFGTSSNNELASTTMHECMHLAAGRNTSKFIQIFRPKLREYYSAFFTDYLELKSSSTKQVDEFIKYMIVCEKRGNMYVNKNLGNLYRLLEKIYSNDTYLSSQDFIARLTNLVVAAKLFIINMNSLMKSGRKFSMVFTSLNRAYKQTFGEKNNYTTPIQEMTSLSEVACVLAEMKPKDPTIKKLFKIIS